MILKDRVIDCFGRVKSWFEENRIEGFPKEVKRFSSLHNVSSYPGMLLPATYNSAHCLRLLGVYDDSNREACFRVADFINSFQLPDGRYRIPEMRDSDVYKRDDLAYTWEYIDFHVTNYALGAVLSLGYKPKHDLSFMEPYLTQQGLERWISRRMFDDAWMEGNNIVNLASFYLILHEQGDTRAFQRVEQLLLWLNTIQDPSTGFWGDDFSTRKGLLYGMAGSMHVYHLYYYLDRELPFSDRIVESCIELSRNELKGVTTACLDVDIVDVLANMHRLGLRRREIEDVLEQKLVNLLGIQNPDGGFPDQTEGMLRFDGWVKGYSEPQGISNCFSTWFRCIAIAIISCILFPETAEEWTFRNTIGIGYYRNK